MNIIGNNAACGFSHTLEKTTLQIFSCAASKLCKTSGS